MVKCEYKRTFGKENHDVLHTFYQRRKRKSKKVLKNQVLASEKWRGDWIEVRHQSAENLNATAIKIKLTTIGERTSYIRLENVRIIGESCILKHLPGTTL